MILVGPPSPTPLRCRDWRGVYKNGLQNLERVGVRGQNLENKAVKTLVAIFLFTASALTMIGSFDFRVKVRCHITVRKTEIGPVSRLRRHPNCVPLQPSRLETISRFGYKTQFLHLMLPKMRAIRIFQQLVPSPSRFSLDRRWEISAYIPIPASCNRKSRCRHKRRS